MPYFGINGLSMILCLWSPLHPLSKLLAIQDHTQNLDEQLWMRGRREVSIISHRPMTRSDLKQERSLFRESVSTFLYLVVAHKTVIFVSWIFEFHCIIFKITETLVLNANTAKLKHLSEPEKSGKSYRDFRETGLWSEKRVTPRPITFKTVTEDALK